MNTMENSCVDQSLSGNEKLSLDNLKDIKTFKAADANSKEFVHTNTTEDLGEADNLENMKTSHQSEIENKESIISVPEQQNKSEANIKNKINGETLNNVSNLHSPINDPLPHTDNNSSDINSTDRLRDSSKNDNSGVVKNGVTKEPCKFAENSAADIPESNKNGNNALKLDLEDKDHNSDSSSTKRVDDCHSNSITQDTICTKSSIISTSPLPLMEDSRIDEESDTSITQSRNKDVESTQEENSDALNKSSPGKRKREDSEDSKEDRQAKLSKVDQCEKLIEEYEQQGNNKDLQEKNNEDDSYHDTDHENNDKSMEDYEVEMLAEIERELLDEDEEEEEKNSKIPEKILSQNTDSDQEAQEEIEEEMSEENKTETFDKNESKSSNKENKIEKKEKMETENETEGDVNMDKRENLQEKNTDSDVCKSKTQEEISEDNKTEIFAKKENESSNKENKIEESINENEEKENQAEKENIEEKMETESETEGDENMDKGENLQEKNTDSDVCKSKTQEEMSEDTKIETFDKKENESSNKENKIEEGIKEKEENENQAEKENIEEKMEPENETEGDVNMDEGENLEEKNIQDVENSNVENETLTEDKPNEQIIKASGEKDEKAPLEQNTTEDDIEDAGVNDIVIGEAFTINEELMKEFDSTSDAEDELVPPPPEDKMADEELPPPEDKVAVEEPKVLPKKADEMPKVLPLKISKKALAASTSLSRKKSPSKHSKKYRRSLMFGNSRKKKKQAQSSKSIPSASYIPPVKTEIELPLFLEELAIIDSSLIVVRDRYDEEGKKFKVHCIVFHEAVLDWAMSETLLSSIDNSKTLRKRLKLKMGGQIMFPENVESRANEIYPVEVGDSFPFAMPVIGKKAEAKSEVEEEVALSFPLEQLCALCPSAAGHRLPGNSNRRLNAITFADEPLEWAFKETFLSNFEDSPILSDLLGLDSSTKIWPDVTEEILAHESIDYKFPFSCPNSKRFYESLFINNLSFDLPASLIHETLELSPLPMNLEKSLYGERDSLVRLLAVASFYKHSSCIPTIRSNRKLSSSHSALIESFRPLIISQANRFATIIRQARERLLVGVTCQNTSIIPAMINGPIHCKRGVIFSNLQKLEAAVAKDPNNKLQNI